jgi:16S rRNA (adenine1518-N6/adenine1519-N6)-dimethyltransferase
VSQASGSPERQTLSHVRGLLEARGIRPKGKLGQNFLIDLNLLELIVRAGELDGHDLALEVGSGTGSLTRMLAAQAGAVVSIEIDGQFYTLAGQAISACENVVLLRGDVLRNKNELNPEVVSLLGQYHVRFRCARIKLVANLPYVVATPVIANLLLTNLPIERMVVTVQLEIAERLTAKPGTSDYGALSVLVQSVADTELVRRLPPSAFWPRPQVSSAVVLIRPIAAKRARVGDVAALRDFLRGLYTHRRKNLRGALAAMPGGHRAKAEVDRLLAEIGLAATARAEDLDVEQHLRLRAAFG